MSKAIQPDFKSIFESAPGLNLVLLPDFTIEAVSDAYLLATMTIRKNIIGHHLFEIFPDNPADSDATGVSNLRFSLNYVLQHKASHIMAVQKYDIRRPDGTFEQRYWSPINKPVLDSGNEVVYIIHRVEDVTEFMLAKKDQAEKEGLASLLQKQVNEMEIEIYNRAQEIQQINQQLLNEIEERRMAENRLIEINRELDNKVLGRANEILKSKNALFETFERITDAFVALDKNWCYTYVNAKAEQIFNKPHGYLIGKHIWTEFPEGIDQTFYRAYYRAMEEQQYIHVEEYYSPYDLWFENHIYPSAEGLSIFFRDITAKKKAEETLKENNRFIESIINASPDIIYIYDIEERKNIYANDGIELNLGYTDAEIKDMDDKIISTLMHPEDFKFYISNTFPRYATVADKETITHEYRIKDKKGNWHWLSCKESVFLRKPDGTPKQIFGIATDISEQKKAEKNLIEKEMQLRLFIENSPAALAMFDKDMKYIMVSKRYLIDYKLVDKPIIGKSHYELFPELPQRWKYIHQRCLSGAIEKNEEEPFLRQDGNTDWVRWEIHPWHKTSGEIGGIILFSEVITERKKAEEAITLLTKEKEITLNRISDGVISFDNEWHYTFLNNAALAENPLTREITLGKKILEVHPELEGTRMWELFRQAMQTKKVMEAENFYEPYGIWIHAKFYPSEDGLTIFYKNITEQKKSERNLQEAHQRLAHHLHNSPLAVIEWDKNFIIQTWSPQAENIFGWSETEVMGKHFNEFHLVFEEDAPVTGIIAQELMTGAVDQNNIINRNNTKAGEVIYCQWFNSVLKDEKGNVNSILSLVLDITEQKKAEKEILNEKNLSNSIINSLPGIFYLYNKKGKFLRWNKNFEVVTGYSANEISKMHPLDFFDTDEKKLLSEKINNVFIAGEDAVEADFFTKAKGKIPYFFTGRTHDYKNEICLLGVGIDISERKNAEKALSESVNRLRLILETEPECVKVLGPKGELLSMNPAGLAMIEADKEEQVIGHKIIHLVNQKYRAAFKKLTKEVFNGKSGRLEFEMTGLKGTQRWLETHAVPMKDTNGKIISLLGVTRNVTERKKFEDQIQKSLKEVRELTAHLQSIREEERKHIGREIHDELGQQLTAVKMDVAWIDKKIPAKDTAIKTKIKNTIHLLDSSNLSIRKILSELRSGILEHQTLVEALKWQGIQFTENTGIPLTFKSSEPDFKLEESTVACIFRVYQEALTNITRYAEAQNVNAALSAKENFIVLMVEDDGKGFSPSLLDQKKSFGILGMKERVLSLNGRFKLASAKGKGTKIVISLPFETERK